MDSSALGSSPKHTNFYQFIFELSYVEKTKENEARISPFLTKKSFGSDPDDKAMVWLFEALLWFNPYCQDLISQPFSIEIRQSNH